MRVRKRTPAHPLVQGLRDPARRIVAAAGARPVPSLMRLLPRVDAWGTAGLGLQVVSSAALGLLVMIATGALIASVSSRAHSVWGFEGPWAPLAVLAGIYLLARVAHPFLEPVLEGLGVRMDARLRERVAGALLAPSTVAHLEDPQVADELRLAGRVGAETFKSTDTIQALAAVVSSRLLATGSAIILFRFRWWAPALLVTAWFTSHRWYRQEAAGLIASLEGSTAALRRSDYIADLLLGAAAAKEVRLFGLSSWLIARFRHQWLQGMREVWQLRRRHVGAMLGSALLLLSSHLVVVAALAASAIHGHIGIGQLTLYVEAVLGLVGFAWDADNQYLLNLGAAPLPHVVKLMELVGEPRFALPGTMAPPREIRQGLCFEDVSFCYPGGARCVLEHLNLRIAPGRSLAIVGGNGAGKSTLVSLICRFYDPTAGRVLVDGVDLARIDPVVWQGRLAAVFQDFGRYSLSARENVVFGSPQRGFDPSALRRAAQAAGISEFVDRLPAGWETPLSRTFAGGIDLSGGQWQRVALARAFFAVEGGADVLILDEPTAALDVRAEAQFYDGFLDITKGLTTILVSHRFSTVRRADQIAVLDGGRVVECGSHEELLASGGHYATMFGLQAAHYQPAEHA